MNRLAVQALEKMETRKFNSKSKGRREGSCGALDTLSSSSTSDCAICLERYIDGEVRKEASWARPRQATQQGMPSPGRPGHPLPFLQLCSNFRSLRWGVLTCSDLSSPGRE